MIYHVYANQSNIGDWLSAQGIQKHLHSFVFKELFCDESFVDNTLSTLSQATKRDFIIIGGGGLFMDYFLPFWDGFLDIASRIPFCIWGVGFCDLKLEPSRPPIALLEKIIRLSRLCIVRDRMTRNHLSSLDLEEPVPCPSIAAIRRPPEPGNGILHVDNYLTVGKEVYETMEAYGGDFADLTQRPFRAKNNRISPGDKDAMASTLQLYEKSDLILTSALHGCIIGLAMGRKVLAVSGDYKIESFMEAAGLDKWVIDYKNVHSLPINLSNLHMQPISLKYILSARQKNEEIAKRIRIMIGKGVSR